MPYCARTSYYYCLNNTTAWFPQAPLSTVPWESSKHYYYLLVFEILEKSMKFFSIFPPLEIPWRREREKKIQARCSKPSSCCGDTNVNNKLFEGCQCCLLDHLHSTRHTQHQHYNTVPKALHIESFHLSLLHIQSIYK